MSHYVGVQLNFRDQECLLAALADLGYTENKVEVHEEATNLFGYMGDKRNQKANIIIRRNFVGGSSNDMGFERVADGSYTAHISQYDQHRHGTTWVGKLTQEYGKHNAEKQMLKKGFKCVKNEFNKKTGKREMLFQKW